MSTRIDRKPGVMSFLTRKRGGIKADWTDYATYGYLIFGVILILVAVGSLKTPANLGKYPPTLLP